MLEISPWISYYIEIGGQKFLTKSCTFWESPQMTFQNYKIKKYTQQPHTKRSMQRQSIISTHKKIKMAILVGPLKFLDQNQF